jgi:hypothetical protein
MTNEEQTSVDRKTFFFNSTKYVNNTIVWKYISKVTICNDIKVTFIHMVHLGYI